MDKRLRVLNVEDNENDSILLKRHLVRAGYACELRREESASGFESALREGGWDVILADYYLPSFNALDALHLAQKSGVDVPFIVVSGAVGEQAAVDVLCEGAADYVMKDSLGRLVPAIERELQKAEERKRRRIAEEALRESEMRLRGILANSPNAVFMKDLEGRYVLVNRCYEKLLGMSEAQISGKTDVELFPPEYATQYMANEAAVSATGVPAQFQERVPLPDGIHIRLANRFPLYGADGTAEGVCTICTDITDLKRSEDSMRRAEKLAAAGRLAASIAHEINNPLEALTNLIYLMRSQPELKPTSIELLEIAEKELKRVSHIARQSLAFYRETTRPSTFRLNELLQNLVDLYAHKIRHREIQLQFEANGNLTILGMEGEIRQVFSNLLANALDATRNQGRIRVRLREARNQAGVAGIRASIADDGCGIPPDVLPRIYDAFFTTKVDGTGTGLGLWVTQTILEKHGATIRFRSSVRPGASGTVVSVFVPSMRNGASMSPSCSQSQAAA